jgi:hypothetical protein
LEVRIRFEPDGKRYLALPESICPKITYRKALFQEIGHVADDVPFAAALHVVLVVT